MSSLNQEIKGDSEPAVIYIYRYIYIKVVVWRYRHIKVQDTCTKIYLTAFRFKKKKLEEEKGL